MELALGARTERRDGEKKQETKCCTDGISLRRQEAAMDFDLDLSADVLRRTPATLQALLGGLAAEWIRGTEGPDTFSPFDVVGHLIDGEETDWIPRARIILA